MNDPRFADAAVQMVANEANDALDRLAALCEARFAEAVRELSTRYPLRTVTGCCAMGVVSLHASGKGWRARGIEHDAELSHPVMTLFSKVDQDYGFGALPVFLMEGRAGVVRVVHDWGSRVLDDAWTVIPPGS